MTQDQIDCEVALALGEDLREVRRRGFSMADPAEVSFDPEPDDLPPQVIDWDHVEANRNVPLVYQAAA